MVTPVRAVDDPRRVAAGRGSDPGHDRRDGVLATMLAELHERLVDEVGGEVATYIPALAEAPPDALGMCVATPDGEVVGVGDVDEPFTIQSVSKPFVYAMALAEGGPAQVRRRVGVEPTGEAFNSIAIDPAGRARNPMVNAGAIVATSLVPGADTAERVERVRAGLSVFAGRELAIDERVWASERETGSRNRGIAHMLVASGVLGDDVEDVLDAYFGQCSILVTARDLAAMAATLAADGVNPATGRRAMRAEDVRRVLTVMSTCGMYDFAGQWLYEVGLPAKSGVAGGIAAVLPGEAGIGTFSPRLDERGNSVRGIAACRQLSQVLGLHLLRPSGGAPTGARRTSATTPTRSTREWSTDQAQVLDRRAADVVVHRADGEQSFASAAALVRRVEDDLGPGTGWVVLDLRRCGRIDTPAQRLLDALLALLAERGVEVAVVDPRGVASQGGPCGSDDRRVTRHADLDLALEWCEAGLLAAEGSSTPLPDGLLPLASMELLRGLGPEELEVVAARLHTLVLTPGQVLFDEGDEPDALYLLAAGRVTADIGVRGRSGRVRVTTLSAGASVGELGLLDGAPRSSRVVVDEPTLCHVLDAEGLDELRREHPTVVATMFASLATSLAGRLRRTTGLLRAVQE